MVSKTRLIRSLAATIFVATISTGSASANDDGPVIARELLYEVPQTNVEPDADVTMPLRIEAKGRLIFAGERVKATQVKALIDDLVPPNFSKMGVVPAGDLAFGDAVDQIAQLAAMGGYELLELEYHRTFAKARSGDGKRIAAPHFIGKLDEYELPVVVAYDDKTAQCVVSLDEMTVQSEELYDRSFDWLDTIVQRAGGVEAVLNRQELFDAIIARIQAAPKTPWRCVAGAMFHIERSGWPTISLEVIERK